MKAVQLITERDNVATALEALDPGRSVIAGGISVTVRDAIPRGHKLAVRSIRSGEAVVKYGSPIGTATMDIAEGAHVHTHNVASTRGRGDLAAAAAADVPEPRLAEPDE